MIQVLSPRRYRSSLAIFPSVLLFVIAIFAAIVANSPLAPIYESFLSYPVYFRIGEFNLFSHGGETLTVLEFINDGLMTFFFFYVGLEIKREVLVGELSSFRRALLPIIAACGGMILPVVVYALVCHPGGEGGNGLAIPMATDIAFSLGVLSLLGKRVPLSLKIFLTTLAVADDIGGILVIAIFYSSHVAFSYLLWAALMFVFIYFMGKRRLVNHTFFLICGVTIWYLFLQSGIHTTISGVILAFLVPAMPRLNVGKYIERIRRTIASFPTMVSESIVLTNEQIAKLKRVETASDRVISPLQSMEDNLRNIVSYVILPLFAFANAGVVFSAGNGESVVGSVTTAVALGLIIGKLIGIFAFTFGAIKLKITPKPEGMNWKNLAGVAMLGGIGFTVSLFIAGLSFDAGEHALLNQAKLGVIIGSVISGILGYWALHTALPKQNVE